MSELVAYKRIINLEVDNFMRLSAARLSPSGHVCYITGPNGSGKSSLLRAIWAALGGKAAEPEEPIRRGRNKASVRLDLGDLVVTRKWTRGSLSSLAVESRDGARFPSPQSVLDKLVGTLMFDPLAFVHMSEGEQARTLKDLAGIDLAPLEAERKQVFDQRTLVNRELKTLESQLASLSPAPEGTPDEETSAEELLAEWKLLNEQKKAIDATRSTLDKLASERGAEYQAAERLKTTIADLQRQLVLHEQKAQALNSETERLVADLANLPVPDFASIDKRMSDREQTNRDVRAKKSYEDLERRKQAKSEESTKLSQRLVAIDASKERALVEAKYPVEDLTVEETGTGFRAKYRGVPFSQASTAEQIRVGLEIVRAMNKPLRAAFSRDGSLLDETSLQLIEEWAEKHDFQVFLERVSPELTTGVVIEAAEPEDE